MGFAFAPFDPDRRRHEICAILKSRRRPAPAQFLTPGSIRDFMAGSLGFSLKESAHLVDSEYMIRALSVEMSLPRTRRNMAARVFGPALPDPDKARPPVINPLE